MCVGGGGVGVFDTCIVVQYVVLFLVLQSSPWGRKSWLLNFYCLQDVMLLLLSFASSPRCLGLVCGV